MTFPPPSGVPGPFGSGDQGPFSPPPGATAGPFGAGGTGAPPNPGGLGFGGPIVVHRARLLPRLALIAGLMLISTAVTGAIVWFSVFSGDDVELGSRRGTANTASESGGVDTPGGFDSPGGVGVPETWPETLRPPEGATIVSAVVSSGGTPDEQMVLVYEVTQDGLATVDALRAQLVAAGLTISSDAIGPDGAGALVAAGAGREANVAVGPTPGRPDVITVSWVLRVGPR
jgi:hypothetical protein